jgi:ribosomal protein S18 acetylase RimI-like enzyme
MTGNHYPGLMVPAVTIRRVQSGDDQVLREVRLRALTTDPGAFGSTDTEVAARPRAFWRGWAAAHAAGDEHCTLLALLAGRAVGLIRIEREPDPGVFGIYSMWVAPEARRRGIALELLAEAERWIEAAGGSEAELNVVDRETAARRLYERAGFRLDGRSEPAAQPGAVELGMRKPVRTIRE